MSFVSPFTYGLTSRLDWRDLPTTVLSLVVVLLLWLRCKKQNVIRSLELAEKMKQENTKPLPSPPRMPIIGHMHLLKDYGHNPWLGFEEIRKEYGDLVSLKMGVHPMVLVSDSKHMKEILLKKGEIFSNRPNFARHHIVFGGDKENSLALCNWSRVHRDRRKMCKRGIVPNKFSSRNQLLEIIISRELNRYVQRIFSSGCSIDKKPRAHSLDKTKSKIYYRTTKKEILFLASDIFMRFLCSETRSHQDSSYQEFCQGCDFIFWDINQSYAIDFLPFLTSIGVGYSYLRKLERTSDFLRDFIDDEIFVPRLKLLERRNSKEYGLENPLTIDDSGIDQSEGSYEFTQEEDYLDTLIIEYLSKVTSMSLADYKVGFADLVAGHAAVANMLMKTLGHISLDREIQELICEEATQAKMGSLNSKPSLPIAEAALQEALRLASSPIVPHVARQDTSIADYYFPKDSTVLFNIFHLNLSHELWNDPYKYDPMRFLEEYDDGSDHRQYRLNSPKHFMPFSMGMRQCLGSRMTETITIMAVANLCKNFIIEADNEQLVEQLLTPKGSVALNPEAPCFEFKLYPR